MKTEKEIHWSWDRLYEMLTAGLLVLLILAASFGRMQTAGTDSQSVPLALLFLSVFVYLYIRLGRVYEAFELVRLDLRSLLWNQLLTLAVSWILFMFLLFAFPAYRLPLWEMPAGLGSLLLCEGILTLCLKLYVQKHHRPDRLLLVYGSLKKRDEGRGMLEDLRSEVCLTAEIAAAQETQAILELMDAKKIQAVYFCGVPSEKRDSLMRLLLMRQIRCYIPPKTGDLLFPGAARLCFVSNLPLYIGYPGAGSLFYAAGKRLFDIVVSGTALILLSPLLLLTAAAVKCQDGGPVFFRQKRLTRDGRVFEILKFRSMTVGSDGPGNSQVTLTDDGRVTSIGRFIRRYRIDELPQLINILKNDMSLVGPRPERIETDAIYRKMLPDFPLRLQVKSGLTGLAQVYGRANTEPQDKLHMDLIYIANAGFRTDLDLLFATLKAVLSPESTAGFNSDLAMPDDLEMNEEK